MQINKMFGWLLVGVGFAMSTGLAQAGTITFSDSNPNFLTFPGYENYEKYNGVVTDEIGNPHVDSMVVAWNDTTGYLTKVTINFRDTTRIDYDTLFINTDFGTNDSNWHGWDYLVRWDIPDNDGNGVNNIDGTLSSGL
ncbi:MAG: hypothetical protein BWK76_12615 [Desulfobulbaceae bacterium A2]|nr:MAG: hypothetical protein BWK76_12615 [Desulfobulbaceae bacterium A2]